MNLSEAQTLAIKLMTEHGLRNSSNFENYWSFGWNNRKRGAGVCKYRVKRIELSKLVTLYANYEDVLDTILHEIAHALAGYLAGHGPKWREIALKIGCNGKRCYDSESSLSNLGHAIAPYKAVCVNGHVHFAYRKRTRKCSCNRCSSRFDARYLLNYQPNV